jgi:putative MFS transporter
VRPQPVTSSVASRLERLPLCGFHHRFVTLIALGGWFDLYDIFMMAYVGAALQTSGFLTLAQFSRLVATGFLGMFVGTLALGLASDAFGRRTAFMWMLLGYSLATLAGAFAPDARFLLVTRFLAGVGVGAELVVIDTYVTEMVPRRARGRYVAIALLIGFTAVPAAALFSWLLIPTHFLMAGWRWVMVIGSAGALFVWQIRRRLPESPRWLEAHGRTVEAEAAINSIETEVALRTGAPLPMPEPAEVETAQRLPLGELWRPAYRARTLMLMVFHLLQTVGVYGFANWAPTFMLRQGEDLQHSLHYGFLMAVVSPLGPLIAVATAERLERKWALVGLALAMALTGLAFPAAHSGAAIVTIGALMTIFSYWFSAVFHAYQAELFPTRARATGVGFTYGWSRLSAVFSSLLIGALLVHGVWAVFFFIAAAMAGAALVVTLFGPRTNAATLEDISR